MEIFQSLDNRRKFFPLFTLFLVCIRQNINIVVLFIRFSETQGHKRSETLGVLKNYSFEIKRKDCTVRILSIILNVNGKSIGKVW